jgi:hypothetical protein
MTKVLIIVVALSGVGALLKRFAPSFGTIDWEKKLEAMPDNAPPKWMFRNITAIRENTERILKRRAVRGATRSREAHGEST